MLEWINIPVGMVILEKRHGTFEVPPFAIAKYPVTNEQYQAFIDAPDGYRDTEWWKFSKDAQIGHQNNPQPQETPFPEGNMPRVMLSFFEAVAFCQWLGHKTKFPIALPTEMQWQWAAQGNQRFVYPYGEEFDPQKCNTLESGIGKATNVDHYPDGTSPFGVFDMAGNAWEWCLTEYYNPSSNDISTTYKRVIRGGSWYVNRNFARNTARGKHDPFNYASFIGFRMALSTPIGVE